MKFEHLKELDMSTNSRQNTEKNTQVTRRTFMKWSAALGSALTVGCASLEPSSVKLVSDRVQKADSFEYDKEVWTGCNVNCGSHCPLRMYVKDGVVVRVNTDNETNDSYGDYGSEGYQYRACVKGRSVRQRIYNPDRLKYPMKRVPGTLRGEGKYMRISWDQAIKEIGSKMKDIKSNYGPDAFYLQYGTGTIDASFSRSWPPKSSPMARLHNLWGGYLAHYSDYSTSQITAELCLLIGASWFSNDISDAANSNLVVLWGNNPANTRMGSARHWTWHLQKAKEKNPDLKFIIIDPHYTDTAIALEAEWIPARPGSDAALVAGMAYHLYKEGLIDEKYMNEHCVGWSEESMKGIKEAGNGVAKVYAPAYDNKWGDTNGKEPAIPANSSYKSYILGLGSDKTEKTPAWAASVTGVPEKDIKKLAERLVKESPAMIVQGWGPQRNANGGNISRAISLATILTKNIGIQGGGSGARESASTRPNWTYNIAFNAWDSTFPANPVKHSISNYTWYQAIKDHKSMTGKTWGVRGLASEDDNLPNPIKFIWSYASNCMLNQHGDINETMQIYKDDSKLECIVTIDNYFTPTAMVSDYILPDATNFEQNDVDNLKYNSGVNNSMIVFQSQAAEPPFECKTIYEIMSMVAKEIGIEKEYTEGRTQDEWLEFLFNETLRTKGDQGLFTKENGLDTYQKAKARGLIKKAINRKPGADYDLFVQDPEKNPLNGVDNANGNKTGIATPSGKFEIFSKRLYNLSHRWTFPTEFNDGKDKITPLPEHYTAWETYGDSTQKDYPFQVLGFHYKQRTHSSYYNCSWNREANPHEAWINTMDAKAKGIVSGDKVEIYNERGRVYVPAKVTSRVMPGVILLPQGAWFNPGGKWYNDNIEHVGTLSPEEVGNRDLIDHGGCMNTLTSLRPAPISKGNAQHSVLADLKRA